MKKQTVDRLTEAAAILCLIAGFAVPALSTNRPGTEPELASLSVRELSPEDQGRFRGALGEARRLVDTNMDARPALDSLKETYVGRHEVWVLSARYEERAGRLTAAMLDYARAVRIQPDYLDDSSGLYLGRRIEKLTNIVMTELLKEKDQGRLDKAGRGQLKAAYFLKRRLAGGCE